MRALRWGQSAYETQADLDLERGLLAGLGVSCTHHLGPGPALAGVEVLVVTSGVQVSAVVLEGAPALRLVLTTTSGYDHIDLAAAQARGVWVARCPLARRDAVVDSAVGMGLALLRDLEGQHAAAREGRWVRGQLQRWPGGLGRAADQRVGVVGCGVIGSRVAQVWEALGAEVWRCDPRLPEGHSAEEVLRACTVVSLHCALTPQTRGLVSRETLAGMRPGAVLVNTARGACVDADALLGEHPLGGVGLDVFPEEPWPRLAELAARPRTLLTPHAAGYHDRLGEAVAQEVAATVQALVEGRPLPHRVG